MYQQMQGAPSRRLLLLLLLSHFQMIYSAGGPKMVGDKCESIYDCGFEGATCDEVTKVCKCGPEAPITNHIDKCGKAAKINESCSFNEQCEITYKLTECRDGICTCRYEQVATIRKDGSIECITVAPTITQQQYIDPAMIGILVAMFLMFITICVVLRLFSRARWRENRTIFNTPNPRLMNVSLLRENKLLHDRRGSKGSSKGSRDASRPASVTSLQEPYTKAQDLSQESKASNEIIAASPQSQQSPSKKTNSFLEEHQC